MPQLPSITTTLEEVTDKLPSKPPCRIFFKNELEQPSGSFKLRGMSYLIHSAIIKAKEQNKEVQVFSSSGGNAGIAAAYASIYYGLRCTVVLPVTSKPIVVEKLKSLGAEVIIKGNHWGEADKYLTEDVIRNLDDSISAIYCHPFDNPLLWEGHASMIDEITQQLSPEDAARVKGFVCSVGGGGLYCGVMNGIDRNEIFNKNKPSVLVVETKQAPTMAEAIKADKVRTLASVNTLATSLASPYLTLQGLQEYRKGTTVHTLIDDLEAIAGTLHFYDTFNKIIEPACGATAAIAFDKQDILSQLGDLGNDDIVVFIICGGSGTSQELLQTYRNLI